MVDKLVIGDRGSVRIQECALIIILQPSLAVIGSLLVEDAAAKPREKTAAELAEEEAYRAKVRRATVFP